MTDYADWRHEPLPPGWDLLPTDRRRAVGVEAELELPNDHQLFGFTLSPVATCAGCDETLFFVEELTAWAFIHLTWSGSMQREPWPKSRLFDAGLPRAAMIDHAMHVTDD